MEIIDFVNQINLGEQSEIDRTKFVCFLNIKEQEKQHSA